jgi:transglutaminase-like putative cysteine protease
MIIKIGFDIQFEVPAPTPMILMLYVHPSRQADLRGEEKITVEPNIPLTDFTDLYGNRCARLLAPAGNIRFSLETLIEDSGQPDTKHPDAIQHPIEDLPNDTLPFLLTSRYCEVDKLSDIAWKLFGGPAPRPSTPGCITTSPLATLSPIPPSPRSTFTTIRAASAATTAISPSPSAAA